jgi:hypothetical protein
MNDTPSSAARDIDSSVRAARAAPRSDAYDGAMTAAAGFTRIRTYAWVLLFVRSILALGLGIAVLATGEIRPAMVNVIAIYWLLGALLTLRWARAHPGTRGERLAYAASIAGIIASLILFAREYVRDVLAEERMLGLLGLFSITIGMLRVFGVFRESVSQSIRRSRPQAIALGALEVALGFVLIFSAELRPIAVPIIGIWGLVGGSIMLSDAIRAFRVMRRGSAIAPDVVPTD